MKIARAGCWGPCALILLSLIALPALSAPQSPSFCDLIVCGQRLARAGRIEEGRLFISAAALARFVGVRVVDGPDGRALMWFDKRVELPAAENGADEGQPRGGWVSARALQRAFGWQFTLANGAALVRGPGAEVQDARIGRHPDRIRLVLDLDGPALLAADFSQADRARLLLRSPGLGEAVSMQLWEFEGSPIPQVCVASASRGVVEVTAKCSGAAGWEVFTLGDPPRVVVDFRLAPPSEGPARPEGREGGGREKLPKPEPLPKPPCKAVWWHSERVPTGAGQAMVHVVAFQPGRADIELKPALAGPTVRQRSTVAQIAKRLGALAAVNGGFFSPRYGVPLGMLVIDGEWIRAPLPRRPALVIMRDGSCRITRLEADIRVRFEGLGFLPVSGINQNHWQPDSVVIYTPRWGDRLAGAPDKTRLVVDGGRVVAIETSGADVPMPPDGFVVSGCGRRAVSLLRVQIGMKARWTATTEPAFPDMAHALGGGPLLVGGGKIVLDPDFENFRSDVTSGRKARTAVGTAPGGKVVLVAVEGPPAGRGTGMTLWELAKLMLRLGCWDAMNLDGGGSTQLVIEGRLVNACAGGGPRPVSNALALVPKGGGG